MDGRTKHTNIYRSDGDVVMTVSLTATGLDKNVTVNPGYIVNHEQLLSDDDDDAVLVGTDSICCSNIWICH